MNNIFKGGKEINLIYFRISEKISDFNILFQAGTANTAPWRVARATATCTASARPTTTWSGSAGASQDGSAPDATFIWNKIARIERTMTKVLQNTNAFYNYFFTTSCSGKFHLTIDTICLHCFALKNLETIRYL